MYSPEQDTGSTILTCTSTCKLVCLHCIQRRFGVAATLTQGKGKLSLYPGYVATALMGLHRSVPKVAQSQATQGWPTSPGEQGYDPGSCPYLPSPALLPTVMPHTCPSLLQNSFSPSHPKNLCTGQAWLAYLSSSWGLTSSVNWTISPKSGTKATLLGWYSWAGAKDLCQLKKHSELSP